MTVRLTTRTLLVKYELQLGAKGIHESTVVRHFIAWSVSHHMFRVVHQLVHDAPNKACNYGHGCNLDA